MPMALSAITLVLIALQLYACKKRNKRLAAITKPFLVPLMTVTAISFIGGMENVASFTYPVIIAMVLYTLGDVLLIPSGKVVLFILGMVSFALGHIVFAFMAAGFGISLFSIILSALIWFTVLIFIFFPRIDKGNHMAPYLKAYSVIVALFGILVSASSFLGNMPAHVIAIIGVAFFAASDFMIAMRMMDGKERDTRVMATYMIAVALLLLSFVLINSR